MSDSRHSQASYAVAASLTWIAGFVDAVGYLAFAKVYTANMSGNSVAVGIALGGRQWLTFLFRFWPVVFYVFGLVAGRTSIQLGSRYGVRRIASGAFLCEAVLLLIVSSWIAPGNLTRGEWQYGGVALLSFAMGVQNATLTHFSSLTLHSGFVTGTLLKCTEEFVRYLTWIFDTWRTGRSFASTLASSFAEPSFRLTWFLAFVWVCYVFGAVTGAWSRSISGNHALWIAVAALLILIGVDTTRPLARTDEDTQEHLP